MGKFIDLTGQRFGRLTVISHSGKNKVRESQWLCLCECGNSSIVVGTALKNGRTKSCGCLRKEKVHDATTKHGMCKSRLWRIWHDMKQRCTNPNSRSYKDYGERGIAVCAEWSDNFLNFYKWALANGYAENLSIDRIDNDKGYYPDNCRWATAQEQTDNRRCSKAFVWEGIEYPSISEAARQLGINRDTLRRRAKKQKEREEK